MSSSPPPDYSLPIVTGAYDVASYHVGKSLVDVIRSSFTGGKIRSGDYYLGRSRPLIQQFYASLPDNEQNTVHNEYQRAIGARERMESAQGFRKFLKAKEYKEVARHLFIIIETASRRAADQNLMVQISEAIAGRAAQPPPLGTTSTLSNPFSDSHEVSPQADINVSNLDQVEMSIFESGATGEAAVVLELHDRDGTTQEIASRIQLEVVSGARTSQEAETATISSFDSTSHGLYGPHSEAGDDAGR